MTESNMNISLENWLRNKLQESEEMQDYAVATDTVRCWIDQYKELNQHDVSGKSEQFKCHSCGTNHSGKNDDQLYEVCQDCIS